MICTAVFALAAGSAGAQTTGFTPTTSAACTQYSAPCPSPPVTTGGTTGTTTGSTGTTSTTGSTGATTGTTGATGTTTTTGTGGTTGTTGSTGDANVSSEEPSNESDAQPADAGGGTAPANAGGAAGATTAGGAAGGQPCIVPVVSFGPADPDLLKNISLVIGTPGYIGVFREPIAIAKAPGATAAEDDAALTETGTALGDQLVTDGATENSLQSSIFTNFIGDGDIKNVCGLVLTRDPRTEQTAEQVHRRGVFYDAVVKGIRKHEDRKDHPGIPIVLVERTDTTPTSITWATHRKLDSVDDLDKAQGRTAMALILRGAHGAYGVKKTADAPLPTEIDGQPIQATPTASEITDASPASLSLISILLLGLLAAVAAPTLHFGVRRVLRSRR